MLRGKLWRNVELKRAEEIFCVIALLLRLATNDIVLPTWIGVRLCSNDNQLKYYGRKMACLMLCNIVSYRGKKKTWNWLTHTHTSWDEVCWYFQLSEKKNAPWRANVYAEYIKQAQRNALKFTLMKTNPLTGAGMKFYRIKSKHTPWLLIFCKYCDWIASYWMASFECMWFVIYYKFFVNNT